MAYGIRALPTFLLFHQGKKIAEMQGADSAKLEAMVADAVKKYNGTPRTEWLKSELVL